MPLLTDVLFVFLTRTCPVVTTVVSMARAVRKAFRESYVDRCGPLGVQLCTKYRLYIWSCCYLYEIAGDPCLHYTELCSVNHIINSTARVHKKTKHSIIAILQCCVTGLHV